MIKIAAFACFVSMSAFACLECEELPLAQQNINVAFSEVTMSIANSQLSSILTLAKTNEQILLQILGVDIKTMKQGDSSESK